MEMIVIVMMSMVAVLMTMLKMRMMRMDREKSLGAMRLWFLIQTHHGSCSEGCPHFPAELRDFIKEALIKYSASITHSVTRGMMTIMVATSESPGPVTVLPNVTETLWKCECGKWGIAFPPIPNSMFLISLDVYLQILKHFYCQQMPLHKYLGTV